MTPEQRSQRIAADLRAKEVKHEKQERYTRSKKAPSKYKPQADADRRCNNARKQIRDGVIPKPTQVLNYSEGLKEYIWLWQGERALITAQDFLLHLSSVLPADSKCYLAVGNGFTKNSMWIGTRLDTPRNVWRHSQTFLSSQSGNTQFISRKIQSQDSVQTKDLWAEVKLLTKGSVNE